MIGALLIFLAELALDIPSGGASVSSPTPSLDGFNVTPGINIAYANANNLASQLNQPGQVINNPGNTLAQMQRDVAQGQAIQQQIAIQIASGKTTITGGSTPPVIRAPSGGTKSFN